MRQRAGMSPELLVASHLYRRFEPVLLQGCG